MSKTIQLTIDFAVRKNLRTPNKSSPALDFKLKKLQLASPAAASPKTPDKQRGRSVTRKSAKKLFDNSCDQENETSPSKQRKILDDEDEVQEKKPENLFAEAKRSLNPAFLTDVKFRDKEYQKIQSFLTRCLTDKEAASIYISGPPGTGKTLSVRHIIDSLKDSFSFKSIVVNCMGCRTPESVYEKILTESGLETPRKRKECLEIVADKIVTPTKGRKKPMTVIVFDEIDELESKNRDVLYTLFEWPLFEGSKVIVVGISNTLDFTKRHLKRMPSLQMDTITTVNFQPYSKDQVKGILLSRLPVLPNGSPLVSDVALELCAKKVSSLCGDIRKALDVVRRAIELYEVESTGQQTEGLKATSDDVLNCGTPRKNRTKSSVMPAIEPIGIRYVSKVLNEVYASKALEVRGDERQLPTQQQLSLCALLLISKFTSKKETTLSRAHRVFDRICRKKSSSSAGESVSDFLNMCHLLESKGFVTVKAGKETSLSKISLNVDESEIEQVMTDKSLLRSILSDSGLVV